MANGCFFRCPIVEAKRFSDMGVRQCKWEGTTTQCVLKEGISGPIRQSKINISSRVGFPVEWMIDADSWTLALRKVSHPGHFTCQILAPPQFHLLHFALDPLPST